ncbi:MAG: hypothetical protein HDR98_04305 [Bacteroides sp.]|nr:hypothetical protein [Bacteroides sp.]
MLLDERGELPACFWWTFHFLDVFVTLGAISTRKVTLNSKKYLLNYGMFTNEIRPCKSHTDHSDWPYDAQANEQPPKEKSIKG